MNFSPSSRKMYVVTSTLHVAEGPPFSIRCDDEFVVEFVYEPCAEQESRGQQQKGNNREQSKILQRTFKNILQRCPGVGRGKNGELNAGAMLTTSKSGISRREYVHGTVFTLSQKPSVAISMSTQ